MIWGCSKHVKCVCALMCVEKSMHMSKATSSSTYPELTSQLCVQQKEQGQYMIWLIKHRYLGLPIAPSLCAVNQMADTFDIFGFWDHKEYRNLVPTAVPNNKKGASHCRWIFSNKIFQVWTDSKENFLNALVRELQNPTTELFHVRRSTWQTERSSCATNWK